jgi:WD40 repeat protein
MSAVFNPGSGGSYEWLSIVLNSLDTRDFAHSQAVCRGWFMEARNTTRWICTHLVDSESLEGHDDAICSLYIIPWRDDLMVSGSEDNTIRVWDLNTQTTVSELVGHTELIIDFTSCIKSNTLLSVSFDSTVRIWDMATWQCIQEIRVAPRYTHCHAIAVVEGILCIGMEKPNVALWDLKTLSKVGELVGHHENQQCSSSVRTICARPEDRCIFTGGDDCRILVWQFMEAEESKSTEYEGAGEGEGEGEDSNQKQPVCLQLRALEGHEHYVRALACSDKILASGSFDETVRLWSLDSYEPIGVLRGHSKVVRCLAMTKTGDFLFSGSWDFTIRVWHVASQVCEGSLSHDGTYVNTIASRGGQLYSGSKAGNVRVWSSPPAPPALAAVVADVKSEGAAANAEGSSLPAGLLANMKNSAITS